MATNLPNTAERVPLHTAQKVQDRIMRRTMEDIALYGHAPAADREARIRELDAEWDTERALETSDGAILLGIGLLGLVFRRRWMFLVPAAIGAFLLQHALQGWCLQMPVLRRMGVRTPYEIAGEKAALMR